MAEVDWSAYATQYDVMARHNPAYQELVAHCLRSVTAWQLKPGDTLADLGAGTGNFSIKLAQALPNIQISHLDADEQMLRLARAKADGFRLSNWRALAMDLDCRAWPLPGLAGVVCVHCIYAVARPREFIHRLCAHLRPGGYVDACDFAREMNVCDWAQYFVRQSLSANGFWHNARLFAKCGQVRRQNRRVAAAQRDGEYWIHDLAEFVECFQREGMTILETSDKLYRGYDTLVVAQKLPPSLSGASSC